MLRYILLFYNVNFPILLILDRKSGCCNVFYMSCIHNPALIGNGSINPRLLCMAHAEKKSKGNGRRMFMQACVLAGNGYTNKWYSRSWDYRCV